MEKEGKGQKNWFGNFEVLKKKFFLKPKSKKVKKKKEVFNACTLKKSVGRGRKSVRSDLTLDFTTLGNGSEEKKRVEMKSRE